MRVVPSRNASNATLQPLLFLRPRLSTNPAHLTRHVFPNGVTSRCLKSTKTSAAAATALRSVPKTPAAGAHSRPAASTSASDNVDGTDFETFKRKFRAGNMAVGVCAVVVIGTILGATLKTNRQESQRAEAVAAAAAQQQRAGAAGGGDGEAASNDNAGAQQKNGPRYGEVGTEERIAGLEARRKKLVSVRDDLVDSLGRVEREIKEKAEKQAKKDEFQKAGKTAKGNRSKD